MPFRLEFEKSRLARFLKVRVQGFRITLQIKIEKLNDFEFTWNSQFQQFQDSKFF